MYDKNLQIHGHRTAARLLPSHDKEHSSHHARSRVGLASLHLSSAHLSGMVHYAGENLSGMVHYAGENFDNMY